MIEILLLDDEPELQQITAQPPVQYKNINITGASSGNEGTRMPTSGKNLIL